MVLCAVAGFEDGGGHTPGLQMAAGTESDAQPTAVNGQETQSFKCKEVNSNHNRTKLGKGTSDENPANTL